MKNKALIIASSCWQNEAYEYFNVIPAKAGILMFWRDAAFPPLDSGFRRNDGNGLNDDQSQK